MVPEAKTSRHPHMVVIHRFSMPNGLRSVARRLSMAVSHKSLPWADRAKPWPSQPTAASWRRVRAMAVAKVTSESKKGVSEGLSALEGKSTRVRHENPSKTPKNGFWRVF